MIAQLKGIVDSVHDGYLILDVGGVGYRVFASRQTLSNASGAMTILTDTLVREDAFLLYGFANESEQAWFRRLVSVQGVGAKAALSILSVCAPDNLSIAIMAGDEAPIRMADGIGPKIARRILTELKDKAPIASASCADKSALNDGEQSNQEASAQALSALINLGYGRSEAYAAITKSKGSDVSEIVRECLKALSSN